MMPHYQIDKGGIKFILGGAHVMSPGLTSPGGRMVDVEQERAVVSKADFFFVLFWFYLVC
jgi:PUA domain protein